MTSFDIKRFPEEFQKIHAEAEKEFSQGGAFFLKEDYIRSIGDKTSAFPSTLDAIVSAATNVRADENSAKYALFVCRSMEDRELFSKNLAFFEFDEVNFPLLALLCFLPAINKIYDKLTEIGLPYDIVRDTIGQFEDCVFLHEERFGCLGFAKRYFDHMQRYVDLRILNIGRLRFESYTIKDAYVLESRKSGEQILLFAGGEMNEDGLFADTPPQKDVAFTSFFRETEDSFIGTPVGDDGKCIKDAVTLKKSEYFIRAGVGDDCISVHIPAKGSLSRKACEESYSMAKEIFKRIYPERDFKAFCCHSWMMAPELKNILNPESNLIEFQKPYIKYPCRTKGTDVFNFVFKKAPENYAELPEDTSLQRALKKIYLSGGYLYEYNGLFTI